MPIYLNGNPNPSAVSFNGTPLTSVWAGNGSYYQEVWGAGPTPPPFPQTIGLQTLAMSNGSGLYFRNMVYQNYIYVRDLDAYGVEYEGEVTFETTFSPHVQIGPSIPVTDNYYWNPDENGTSYSFYGDVPSGFRFYRAESVSSTSSIAFDVYQNESGQLRPEDLVVMNLLTSVRFNDQDDTGIMSARFITQTTGRLWPVLTRSSGWIYQNTGRLLILFT